MRILGCVIAALVLVLAPGVADAGAKHWVMESKLSTRTRYGDQLGRHIEGPEGGLDGGIMSVGGRRGAWTLVGVMMGHDAITVQGGHKDALLMLGADLRHHTAVTDRLHLALRAGFHYARLYGPHDSPLEQYRGIALRTGVGLRFRTLTCDRGSVHLTADVVRNDLRLASDGAKDIADHSVHLLLGLEYTDAPGPKNRCIW